MNSLTRALPNAAQHIVHQSETICASLLERLPARIQRLLRGPALVTLADQFIVSAANFALGIAVARLVGVAEFGQFTLALVLSALGIILVNYFLCAPMMTLAGGRKQRSGSYFAAVMVAGVGLGILTGFIVGSVVAGLLAARDGVFPVGLFLATFHATVGLALHNMVRRTLFARNRRWLALWTDTARFVLLAVLCAGMWVVDIALTAEAVLHALGASALLAAAPGILATLRARWRPRLVAAVAARHWPMARWLVLMSLISIGQEQLVWMLVAFELGDSAVGGLRAAQYLLGVTHFIMMAMENYIPRTAAGELAAGGRPALVRYLTQQTLVLGLPTFGLILMVCGPSALWLETFFGTEFAAYAAVVWVFGLAYALIFIRDLWTIYLRTVERTRGVFTSMAISSLAAALAIMPVLDAYGPAGAAGVMLFAHAVSMAYILATVVQDYRANT